jgi:hypothetical protein
MHSGGAISAPVYQPKPKGATKTSLTLNVTHTPAPSLSSNSDTLTLSALQHGLVQLALAPCSMQLLDASMTWHR